MVGPTSLHKRLLSALVFGFLALGAGGCNSTPTPATNAKQELTTGIATTAKKALNAMLKSPKVQQLQGAVFGVVEMANDTKQRLDTAQLTQMLLKTLQEIAGNKFDAVKTFDDDGQSADHTIGGARALQGPQIATRKPSLFLDASIVQRTSGQHTDYILVLDVIKIATGLQVWSGEFSINGEQP
ncbi:hypothetical protein NHP190002_07270 [Helicobacter ailurogastricus]|uniref:hypothetical protein n=1 Tax=Helicobacter ailurogastricus TaxID=1578720 RepID=UPI000CF05008|nr:hypothetical protein [Helicobacter ailurogastricus]GMB90046.1 hypothetical protein NHP190002_07270 [Helicobacter ailurogastricus]GMB91081.1 hypothetical protein NHP190009_02460 [Helicobacter ailurogastricus]